MVMMMAVVENLRRRSRLTQSNSRPSKNDDNNSSYKISSGYEQQKNHLDATEGATN